MDIFLETMDSGSLVCLFLFFIFVVSESIFLYENQIGGVLPDFSNLDLVRLQLQNNTLTGTIPDSLWTNTRLLDVRLDGNQLMGTISTSIGDMAELFDLRLSTNALTGTIPAELAKLSTLRKS
jgi:hypothetical protein